MCYEGDAFHAFFFSVSHYGAANNQIWLALFGCITEAICSTACVGTHLNVILSYSLHTRVGISEQ